VASDTFSKAASVGTNTVYGSSPVRVVLRLLLLKKPEMIVKFPFSPIRSSMVVVPSSCAEAVQVAALNNNKLIKAQVKLVNPDRIQIPPYFFPSADLLSILIY
jgi:hypothetical protein